MLDNKSNSNDSESNEADSQMKEILKNGVSNKQKQRRKVIMIDSPKKNSYSD